MKNSNNITTLALLFNSAFSGAFVFIAVVMVPFWSAIGNQGINDWFSTYFWRFPTIMVPLNLLTFIFIGIGTYQAYKAKTEGRKLWYTATLVMLLCSLTYPLVFDGANKVMMNSGADLQEVRSSFDQWVNWHWVRTALSVVSLILLVLVNNSRISLKVSQ